MLKQAILGSPLGRLAMAARDRMDLATATKETLGTIINDQLAGWLITRLCRPDMTFVDVGAHIGSIIAEVQAHCPRTTIVAVEAMSEKVALLRRKFPGVTIHECAVGDEEGPVTFYVDEKRSGYSSLAARAGLEIVVQKRKLDDLLDGARVDAMKIDVEGAELGVLRGAVAIVARDRPTIMFESGPQEVLGYSHTDMFDWFDGQGYGLLLPNRMAHEAPPMSKDCYLDSHHYPRHTTNYFAVARERIEEVRNRVRSLS